MTTVKPIEYTLNQRRTECGMILYCPTGVVFPYIFFFFLLLFFIEISLFSKTKITCSKEAIGQKQKDEVGVSKRLCRTTYPLPRRRSSWGEKKTAKKKDLQLSVLLKGDRMLELMEGLEEILLHYRSLFTSLYISSSISPNYLFYIRKHKSEKNWTKSDIDRNDSEISTQDQVKMTSLNSVK